MKKIISMLLIVLLASTFAFAEGSKETGAAAVDEWEIPFLNCLTGPLASIGAYLQWGADFAAKQINEAGGIAGKPVRIVGIDTGTSPEKGTVEMSKLVGSALCVLGPVPEPVIMAAVPIAVDEGLYCFTASTSFEYAEPYFPWANSFMAPTEEKLYPIVQKWVEITGVKKVVQFIENYGAWPGMAKAHDIGIKKGGAEVLPFVDVPQDAVAFGPLIVKALAQNPDGIIFACKADKAAQIIIELKGRGWDKMGNLLVFSSADDAALYTTGGKNLNGVCIYNYNDPHLSTPRWNTFRQAFKDNFSGIEPFSLSPNYYDAVYMIKRAIEATGITGDPKKLKEERIMLRDYCNEIKDFEGLQFNWTNKGGYPRDKPIFLFEIKDSQKVFKAKT